MQGLFGLPVESKQIIVTHEHVDIDALEAMHGNAVRNLIIFKRSITIPKAGFLSRDPSFEEFNFKKRRALTKGSSCRPEALHQRLCATESGYADQQSRHGEKAMALQYWQSTYAISRVATVLSKIGDGCLDQRLVSDSPEEHRWRAVKRSNHSLSCSLVEEVVEADIWPAAERIVLPFSLLYSAEHRHFSFIRRFGLW